MKNFLKIIAATLIGSLLAMLVGFFLFVGFISSLASFTESKTPAVPSSAVMALNFSPAVTEQSIEDPFSALNPFSNASLKSTSILDFVQTIDNAASDPRIKFIYMNLNNVNAGISHIEEIRGALSRFRESGKPIIAYADNYSQGAYYLASVADKIYLNPSGMSTLTGLTLNTLFFKDLLDKTGIEVQLIRHGKFKAAAEQFISNKMSEENREQLSAYINSVWDSWTIAISESRGISVEKINLLVDNLDLANAQDALDAGLVDDLLYKDELTENLVNLFGAKDEKGLKMISSTAYSRATKKTDFKQKNKIAVLYANGDIIMGKSSENIASDTYQELISKVRKDSTIKAVVLRINSPGGSAQSSDIIERELALLKEVKPLVVSMGDYAASGGYWIASNADKIYTTNATLTGSIGVFSMVINGQKALNKHLRVYSTSVNTNSHSDLMNGYRPLDNKEVAFIQSTVEDIYTDFVKLVSKGRSMTSDRVDSVGQGRIWSGSDAIRIGLADERGGLIDAINSAASMAGLEGWRIVEYPVIKSQMDKILETISNTENSARVLSSPELLLERAYESLKKESGIKTLARVPYNVEIAL
jgi:protease-4